MNSLTGTIEKAVTEVKTPMVSLSVIIGVLIAVMSANPSPTAAQSADDAQGSVVPYPAGTLTGVPQVDAVISAALSADAEALHDLLQFVERPCTPGGGIGEVACPEGSNKGDLVGAVTYADCDGWGTPELPLGTIRDFSQDTKYLFAVLRTPDPTRPFMVIFGRNASGDTGRGLSVGDRGVTGLFYGCAQTAPNMAEFWNESPTPLLPLRVETAPGPPATGSGLRETHRDSPLFSLTGLVLALTSAAILLAFVGRLHDRP